MDLKRTNNRAKDLSSLFNKYCIILYNFVELNQNKLIARNTQRCLLYHN